MSTPTPLSDRSSTPLYRPALHAFAVLVVLCTFVLVVAGGNVTSLNAGMTVPDWPTSFGYNMFTLPFKYWDAGVRDEHVHRLIGSGIGMLCLVLTPWMWRAADGRKGFRWLAVSILLLVVIQGLMGGFRVTENSIPLAIVHGVVGQLFLCLVVLAAAATSRWWIATASTGNPRRQLEPACLALLGVLVIQLILGAAARHTQSGLAIPDFPTSYGSLIPPTDTPMLQQKIDAIANSDAAATVFRYGVPRPWQVWLHFAHRAWALAVVGVFARLIVAIGKRFVGEGRITRPVILLVVLMLAQLTLGALTVMTARVPWVATAHQSIGALILAVTALLAIRTAVIPPTNPALKGTASQNATPRASAPDSPSLSHT